MKTVRRLLPVTAIAAAVVLFMALGARSDDKAPGAEPQRLEGTWTLNVTLDGLPLGLSLKYTSLATFQQGGGATQLAWLPPGTVIPASIAGMSPWLAQGEWARTGNRQFALAFHSPRFDSTGSLLGLTKCRASIQVDDTQRQASGRFTGDILDANGALLLSVSGIMTGSRMQVETPQ